MAIYTILCIHLISCKRMHYEIAIFGISKSRFAEIFDQRSSQPNINQEIIHLHKKTCLKSVYIVFYKRLVVSRRISYASAAESAAKLAGAVAAVVEVQRRWQEVVAAQSQPFRSVVGRSDIADIFAAEHERAVFNVARVPPLVQFGVGRVSVVDDRVERRTNVRGQSDQKHFTPIMRPRA